MDYSKLNHKELSDCKAELIRLISDLENRISIQGKQTDTEGRVLSVYNEMLLFVEYYLKRLKDSDYSVESKVKL